MGDVDAGPCAHLGCLPDGDRLRLPLRLYRPRLLVVDDVSRGAIRRLVGEDAVDRRGALQAGRGVHDVARGHALALGGARIERDEDFAGRDPDPELEAVLDGELADREGCADRPFGIVLVRDRSAEERHHRVADELLDRAAVVLELRADPGVVGAQDRLDVLRVERLRLRGEPDEVAEEHAHDLALAAPPARGHGTESTT